MNFRGDEMVKNICYVIGAGCALLGVVSLLDVLGVIEMGMTFRNLAIGVVGAFLSVFLGRNISHIERDEADRGGPSLRR